MTEPKGYDEERLIKWRDEMLALGLSTAPPDKEAAERIIDDVYKERKLKPPEHKFWAISPKAGLELVNELAGTKNKWYPPFCGASELYWLGHWAFIKTEFKIECEADPFPQIELARACGGWYWPFENAVIFTERPCVLKRDNEGRLHSENGPAIAWRDDYKLYFWHGVAIPEDWIEKKADLDPKVALTWENIEQRRCAAEIIGWEKILTQLNPKVVNKDEPEIGVLLEVNLPDSGKERFLKVQCGTGRTFVLPVPPSMKTALEANAWTFGLTAEDLKIEVRT